jgi:hypothetical protein
VGRWLRGLWMVLLGLSRADCVSEGFTDWKVVVLIFPQAYQVLL